jgi:hypothetical protein
MRKRCPRAPQRCGRGQGRPSTRVRARTRVQQRLAAALWLLRAPLVQHAQHGERVARGVGPVLAKPATHDLAPTRDGDRSGGGRGAGAGAEILTPSRRLSTCALAREARARCGFNAVCAAICNLMIEQFEPYIAGGITSGAEEQVDLWLSACVAFCARTLPRTLACVKRVSGSVARATPWGSGIGGGGLMGGVVGRWQMRKGACAVAQDGWRQ